MSQNIPLEQLLNSSTMPLVRKNVIVKKGSLKLSTAASRAVDRNRHVSELAPAKNAVLNNSAEVDNRFDSLNDALRQAVPSFYESQDQAAKMTRSQVVEQIPPSKFSQSIEVD